MRRAGPLVYTALLLLIAYSLSAGNAGTAFRYRTHLVGLMLCLLLVLRQQRSEASTVPRRGPRYRSAPRLPRTKATA